MGEEDEMKALKTAIKHVDLINCCIIWAIFFVLYNNMLTNAIWVFGRVYVWFGVIPLAYGIFRFSKFGKSPKEAVLSIVNAITLPAYCLIVLVCIGTHYG